MRLTVLGCSGSVPGPGAAASGYLLEAEGFRLVVDFGNGVFARYQALHDPFSIGAVLLTHLHPDHCIDMTALYVTRKWHPLPAEDRLPVYAPVEAPARFAAAYAPNAAERVTADFTDVFDFHVLSEQTLHIGPFEIVSALVAHPCEAYGFRITHNDAVLAYTGDSGPCDGLEVIARDADVLLAEASWPHTDDRLSGVHLSGTEAGELAERGKVGRLLVTHVPPWTDRDVVLAEARAAFTGSVDLVGEGDTFEIG